jgi:putative tryptophan/tyrosine transport system substrate-binding protein
MKRREFITLLGGAAAAWPLAAHAQQDGRVRRIGMLLIGAEGDPVDQSFIAEFRQGMQDLGWTEDRNLRIDYRWTVGDPDRYRKYAAELVSLAPDVIVTTTNTHVTAVRQVSATVPIVMAGGTPVDRGLVESLARPGGNTTGFESREYILDGKLLELLKEIAPRVTRVAVILGSTKETSRSILGVVKPAAAAFGVELHPIDERDAGAIERDVAEFASQPNGGLLAPGNVTTLVHRELLIKLAASYRLPAVYPNRVFVADGGLISYGIVRADWGRRVAGYVDRILGGEKPANLPVQLPVRYETVLNLNTAKALGIEVPTSILVRADEVIE